MQLRNKWLNVLLKYSFIIPKEYILIVIIACYYITSFMQMRDETRFCFKYVSR